MDQNVQSISHTLFSQEPKELQIKWVVSAGCRWIPHASTATA